MRTRIRATGAACHLCGRAIDYSLPSSDPKSFVIDHVTALANGGQDALSNVKAAHRRHDCNSKKRARVHDDSVRRSNTLK
ncbi:HNH endonuclease [Curtobacterium sp. GD1]|uniref:HNH endonuclease n=1 Tax=Curtobacterium sp. GD1 TaxID=2810612 RepID=UPI0035B23C6B